jgi:cell division septum initiation protein DivIVA
MASELLEKTIDQMRRLFGDLEAEAHELGTAPQHLKAVEQMLIAKRATEKDLTASLENLQSQVTAAKNEIAAAKREADATLAAARNEATRLVDEAKRESKKLIGAAKERAAQALGMLS